MLVFLFLTYFTLCNRLREQTVGTVGEGKSERNGGSSIGIHTLPCVTQIAGRGCRVPQGTQPGAL